MARKQEPKVDAWRKLSQQKSDESRSMPPALTPTPAPKLTKERKQAIQREAEAKKHGNDLKASRDADQARKEVVEAQKKKRAQP